MAVTLNWSSTGFDIFVNIWQSNNYSSYHIDPAVDVGHARIYQMPYTNANVTPGNDPVSPVAVVTGEPLTYPGAFVIPGESGGGRPLGHILAFCRDYYLPNRLTAGRNILIIPCAQGGTGYSSGDHWGVWAGVGHNLHERCIARVNAAMAAYPGSVIKACFCQGGEADGFWRATHFPNGTPTTYYEDLEGTEFTRGTYESFRDYCVVEVADFRARWTGGASVPFLFGQMSPEYMLSPIAGPGPLIRSSPGYRLGSMWALEEIASAITNSISIPSAGLTCRNIAEDPANTGGDGAGGDLYYGGARYIHFDAISQRGGTDSFRTETNPLSKRYWTGFQALVP